MNKRKLGNLEVSSIGLGCMGMTHAYGAPSDDKEMIKIIHQAVDFGCTFFDTAECYVGELEDGTVVYNESLVGAALGPYRSKVILATKFGINPNTHLSTNRTPGLQLDSRPETIRSSVEGSLRRLQTDYIDLYYQHRVDPNIPLEEVAGTMQELVKEGKIRYWGMSEATAAQIRTAHAVYPVTAVQSRYSIIVKNVEAEVLPTLEELGIGLVAHGPLGNGFLSGRYSKDSEFEQGLDFRSFMPHFKSDKLETNMVLVDLLKEIGESKGATPAQIALAWVMSQKPWIVPIPGTRKLDRLAENLDADKFTVTQDEIERINEVADSLQYA